MNTILMNAKHSIKVIFIIASLGFGTKANSMDALLQLLPQISTNLAARIMASGTELTPHIIAKMAAAGVPQVAIDAIVSTAAAGGAPTGLALGTVAFASGGMAPLLVTAAGFWASVYGIVHLDRYLDTAKEKKLLNERLARENAEKASKTISNFGGYFLETEKEIKTHANYMAGKTPLVLSQKRPAERKKHLDTITTEQYPLMYELRKNIVKTIHTDATITIPELTFNRARADEIEAILFKLTPDDQKDTLLSLLRKSGVTCNVHSYRDVPNPAAFSALTRTIIARALYSLEEAHNELLLKKKATLEEEQTKAKKGWETELKDKEAKITELATSSSAKDAEITSYESKQKQLEANNSEALKRYQSVVDEDTNACRELSPLRHQTTQNANLRNELSPLRRRVQSKSEQIAQMQRHITEMHAQLRIKNEAQHDIAQ